MRTSKLLALLVVVQTLVLLNQWLGSPVSTARGQIPDAGMQQVQVITELTKSNEKLDKIIDLLQAGKLQVEVVKPVAPAPGDQPVPTNQ